MLSNIPQTLSALRESNDFGAKMVKRYPSRFGLLAAIPTDDGEAALAEVKRSLDELGADGIAMTMCYKDNWLTNESLEKAGLWEELDKRGETVHVHPKAYAESFGETGSVDRGGI